MSKNQTMTNKNKNLSQSNSNSTSSSSEKDSKTPENKITEYEKQRQTRIAENKARMELLGLNKIVNSLMGSSLNSRYMTKKSKPESKRVVKDEDNDDDYTPNDDDYDVGFTSFSDESDEEFVSGRKSGSSYSRKLKKSKSIKQTSSKLPMEFPEDMDENEALKQAIALSLKDLGETPGLQRRKSSQGSDIKSPSTNKKGRGHNEEDNVKQKKRKSFSSRVQMTEDELVIHFCQIDEAGKGCITLRDLERMAVTHDFMWNDKELADMIRCFDTDRDGKLTLDDFRNIVLRCNLLQVTETL